MSKHYFTCVSVVAKVCSLAQSRISWSLNLKYTQWVCSNVSGLGSRVYTRLVLDNDIKVDLSFRGHIPIGIGHQQKSNIIVRAYTAINLRPPLLSLQTRTKSLLIRTHAQYWAWAG